MNVFHNVLEVCLIMQGLFLSGTALYHSSKASTHDPSPPPRNLTWESTARNTLYSLYRWCWIHFWSLHFGKLIGLTISYNFHINLHHPRWGFDLILNIFHLYIVPRWLLTWLPVLSLNRYEFIGGSLRNHIYV